MRVTPSVRRRRTVAALAVALLIGIAAAAADIARPAAADEDEKLAKTLERALLAHFDALNAENVGKAMQVMHARAPGRQLTEQALRQQLATYDLKYKLVSFKLIGTDGEYAVCRVSQETAKIAGPVFQDNLLDMMHVFRKDGASWKLWQSAVLEMKKLGQPR